MKFRANFSRRAMDYLSGTGLSNCTKEIEARRKIIDWEEYLNKGEEEEKKKEIEGRKLGKRQKRKGVYRIDHRRFILYFLPCIYRDIHRK